MNQRITRPKPFNYANPALPLMSMGMTSKLDMTLYNATSEAVNHLFHSTLAYAGPTANDEQTRVDICV